MVLEATVPPLFFQNHKKKTTVQELMYIHQYNIISPQGGQSISEIETPELSVEGKMFAKEPKMEGVPPAMLRRMSKAVRMGIGTGLPLLKNHNIEGIILGTANGGMEDCIKFLNQIVEYNEGLLTPGNFVQSTPNAIAGQLSMISKNHGYNATHVHKGLSFENALIDAGMIIDENPGKNYLVGGVDEISTYNFNIDLLAGWYNQQKSNENLYQTGGMGTIAGEGAAMFLVNDNMEGACSKLESIEIFHTQQVEKVVERFRDFLRSHDQNNKDYIFLSGENGDGRHLPFYEVCENELRRNTSIIRFKHLSGEYPTATAFGLWLACNLISKKSLPEHLFKTALIKSESQNIILYNQYQGEQHCFMLIKK